MPTKIRENGAIMESQLVIHLPSPEDSAAMTTLKSAVAAMKGKHEGVAARGPFNGIREHVASPATASAFGQIRGVQKVVFVIAPATLTMICRSQT